MRAPPVPVQLFRYPDTIPPVLYVGRLYNAVGAEIGMMPHTHPRGVEVAYLERGEMEWWIESDVYELRPHDVLVTLPRVPHGTVDSAMSPCEFMWIHIDPLLLPGELQQAITDPGFGGLHRALPDVGGLVGAIFQEHVAGDAFSADTCRSLATLLVAALAREAGQGGPSQISELVSGAQKVLLDDEDQPPSVAAVADRLSVSTVWLTKKFRKEVGQAPAGWLRSHKMAEAKRFLAMRTGTISDIAFRLGFASSQYFATAFRKETGMAPSQYRRLHSSASGR